ncbi:bifunctional metallophosphatase/5'-nucleotidase [Anaerosporobacter faecicola]|uniref:bifunctional metallophosphatase/5'-nucleotidase n=1 Tax=Anaerosporobacter faecicola TaxID=2718714 RepID=UPI00143C3BF3|nr:5'-nucleotidase C-terminal domain-containing protein [Anaerosporobacter faecicola]
MKKLSKKLLALLLSVMMVVTLLPGTAFAEETKTENKDTVVKIFHTNDVHSRYNEATNSDGTLSRFGYAKFKTLVNNNRENADRVFVFDAGDTFHGQSFATLEQGKSIAKVLKAVGYNAMVAGNHDFNYGSATTTKLAKDAGVKLLGANVLNKKTGKIASGYKEYITYKVNDVKIGVFGLSTPETAYKTNPKNVSAIKFADPVKTAKSVVEKLRNKEDVDVVICLAHLGIDEASGANESYNVAAKVDGINLIIDGHSHSQLGDYHKVNNTLITSTGEYLETAGMVTITIDQYKNVDVQASSFKASDYNASMITNNEYVQSVIDSITAAQEPILNQVVASTPIELEGRREYVRTQETNLSRLITSAMLNETGADVAITNGGGIRASIDKGDITKGEAITVLPFGNYIVTVKVTGKELKEAIEHGLPEMVDGKIQSLACIAQVAGIEVTYNPEAPKGSRIVTITKNGKAIKDTDSFVVATNDFMATGGDDYTMLAQPVVNEFSALDEALINYISKIGSDGIKKIDEESPRVSIAK